MIITCPHCQTKYQVTYEAIGSAGRKVQCAHCQQAWKQRPLNPNDEPKPKESAASQAVSEDVLDDAIETEARRIAKAAKRRSDDEAKREQDGAGKLDPAVIRMRQRAFTRREHAISASMPLARLRRVARYGLALMLIGGLATGYFARFQVVERFPDMAGVYESIGLGVNVVGLDFTNVTTMRTVRDGKEVLTVSAQIIGRMPNPVSVPPVVVTLLDSHGEDIYQWSVTPSVRDLMTSERATFNTQLTLPPGEASQVRLSFASSGSTRSGDKPAAALDAEAQGAAPAHVTNSGDEHSTSAAEAGAHEEAEDHGTTAEHTTTSEHGNEKSAGSTTPDDRGDGADHSAPAPTHSPAPEHH